MIAIKVKCLDENAEEEVSRYFDWYEESGKLYESATDSIRQVETCENEGKAVRRARRLCRKSGLKVVSLDIWEA